MPVKMIRNFLKLQSSGGILLCIAAVLALIMRNSPLDSLYDAIFDMPVVIQIGKFAIDKPLLLWVNDGLMAIFFLLVGAEIKREVLEGELSNRKQIALPAVAAIGGFVVPAAIYAYINWQDAEAIHGWAIPAATDIAFALAVIALLGKRIPESLKITLLAIAIIDDLLAILVIALFYTANLSVMSLVFAAMAVVVLWRLNQKNVTSLGPYIVTGIFLWICVLKSGVHATLAGVVLAMFIPLKTKNEHGHAPLRFVEEGIHPWVIYGVLPLFAFANAGVSLQGLTVDVLMHPITLGIAAGLFVGKQIGVLGFTALAKVLGICKLPSDINWKQFYGLALVTGIGFTMSLFIGTLAFDNPEVKDAVRLGVIFGSVLSGMAGYVVLRLTSK